MISCKRARTPDKTSSNYFELFDFTDFSLLIACSYYFLNGSMWIKISLGLLALNKQNVSNIDFIFILFAPSSPSDLELVENLISNIYVSNFMFPDMTRINSIIISPNTP